MNPFLKNTNIYLRGISLDDVNETYLAWMNDREVTKGLVSGLFPSSIQQLENYIKGQLQQPFSAMFAICTNKEDKHIGNIKIDSFNWISGTCELGILIGDRSEWGKGYGKEACDLVINYAFEDLNLRKVTLVVFSNNPAAQRLYEKIGFQIEGSLKDHIFVEGSYYDKIYMSKFR